MTLDRHSFVARSRVIRITWATRQCGVQCFVGQFVQGSTFVLRMNICGKSPALRVAANRYLQPEQITSTMKYFFKNIFNKDKKIEDKPSTESSTEPLTETQILDILSNVICDVGYWNWWTTKLPTVIQIEFGGTQLYFPPADNSRPLRRSRKAGCLINR